MGVPALRLMTRAAHPCYTVIRTMPSLLVFSVLAAGWGAPVSARPPPTPTYSDRKASE